MEEVELHLFTDNVTVNIEVLSAFMNAFVMGDVAREFIVTIHSSSVCWFNLKITKEVA